MIIVKVNGGLGNQLQQYAMYDKLRSMGKDVKVDISWFQKEMGKASRRNLELDYFPGVSYEACTEQEMLEVLGKRDVFCKVLEKLHLKEKHLYVEHQMYDTGIFELDNKVLEGYWACEGYWGDRIPELRKQLIFPKSDNPKNEKMLKKIRSTESVSIHIRRGDYLNPENQAIYGGICTDEYYEKAISYMEKKLWSPHFFIFSDDAEYAKKTYTKENYTVVDINHGRDSFYDMYLMGCCKHNICANSTFSFWGARLNENPYKLMIRPLKQRNTCDWYVPEIMKQLWKDWIMIDEKGQVRVE